MAFKKTLQSDAPIVIGNNKKIRTLFPPGFCYRIGGIIYTIKKDVTQEQSSPMREVILSDGATEIIPVESIIKDLKEPDCEVLEMDKRFTMKEPVVEKVVNKKVKKKKKKNG